MILVLLLAQLNLNGEPLTAIKCDGGVVCARRGTVGYVYGTGAAGSSGYATVQDEGVSLTARTSIDFVGAGVTCTDTGAKTSCSIPGGGAGSGPPVDAGFIVWSASASTGSTNERVLSAGNYTAVNTATAGEVRVNWTHGLTCTASQALTSNGADAMQCRQFAFSDLTGSASTAQLPTVPVTKGGTNLTTVATNQVWVGTAADTVAAKTLPSCSNATTSKLLFDNATQTWSCGTDQTGGGGGGGLSPYVLSFGGF